LAQEAVAVDGFYREPRNLPVPVSAALLIVVMQSNGETPDAVANFAAGIMRAIQGQ
jgi:hypothetical protein